MDLKSEPDLINIVLQMNVAGLAFFQAYEAAASSDDAALHLVERIATPLQTAVGTDGSNVLRSAVEKGFRKTVAKLIERGQPRHHPLGVFFIF